MVVGFVYFHLEEFGASDVASVAGLTTQPRCRGLKCLRKLGSLGGTRTVERARIDKLYHGETESRKKRLLGGQVVQ